MYSRIAEVRPPCRIRRDLGTDAFKLPAANIFQVLALRSCCGGLVEINRNLITLPNLGANLPRHGHTIFDAHAFDGNKGNHVRCAHARMRSPVNVQIDQFGRLAHAAYRRFLKRLALAHQRDHAAVMVGVHLAIEQVHAVHLHGRNNGVHLGFIAAFREIGYTFDQC